jgi:RecT family
VSTATLALAPSNGRGLRLTTLDDLLRFAEVVVRSGLAPKSFDTPEKVVIALVTGMELGISAMQSLQGLAVTNGRIGVMGDLALALCQASSDFEDYQEDWLGTEGADDWGCRITVKRRNQSPKVGQFSVLDAKRANLWGKRSRDGAPSPWITYPQRMLRYRALGFVLRDAFPDVLKGVKTVEELQDYPEESKGGFSHAKPVEGTVLESEVKQPEVLPAPQASNGNDHPDKAPAAASEGQTITGMVERAWPNTYQDKRYYFAKVNGQQLQTTDPEVGEALLSAIGKEILAQVDPSPKPGKWYVHGIQQKEFPAPAEPEPQAEPATPARPVPAPPPPAEQPFAGKIDKAWRQGEPGACVYIARVGGIHLQTRDAAAGEQLLAMEGQNLWAVIRPGTHPSQVHFVRFDDSRQVLETANADRIARRAAAKARHEGSKPATLGAPAGTPATAEATSKEAD